MNEYIRNPVAEVKQRYNMMKPSKQWPRRNCLNTGIVGTPRTRDETPKDNVKNINEDYLGGIDLRTLLPTLVENLHVVSHFKNETFTALQCAQDFGTILKESLKRTTEWGAKYFTHEKSYFPIPKSSMELGDVNLMKTRPIVSIDPQIETAMKELVDRYRHVRQRTGCSETTKDKAGALPPAVYSSQLSCTKVIFHGDAQHDSVTENREGIEQNTCMPPAADDDHVVTGITFVDDNVVAVVAVGDRTDLPESDVDDNTPSDITVSRSDRAIRAHFRLDL